MEGLWKLGIFPSYPGYLEAKARNGKDECKGLQNDLDADDSVHKCPSVPSPLQGRSYDSQATDSNNDVNKNEFDGGQKHAEAQVDLKEQ